VQTTTPQGAPGAPGRPTALCPGTPLRASPPGRADAAAVPLEDLGQLVVEGGLGELAELGGGEGAVGADEPGVGETDGAPGGGGGGVGVEGHRPGGVKAANEGAGGGGGVAGEDADHGQAVAAVAAGGLAQQRELADA